MKFIVTIALILFQLIAFTQTKEDFLTCFEMITEHDNFQPAFENRSVTGENLIIVANTGRRLVNQNEAEKIRRSLTTDDFYDFSESVKVIQGNEETLRNLGIDPLHTLNIGFSGNSDTFFFSLNTVVQDRNLMYNWNYKFVKEDGEWILIGENVNTSRTR